MEETGSKADVAAEYLNGILTLIPHGEIDHHTAARLREKMDEAIYFYRAPTVLLILGEVSFMDSAGLGLILGRYTKQKELGGEMIIEDAGEGIMKILRLAGADRLIPTRRGKHHEMSGKGGGS